MDRSAEEIILVGLIRNRQFDSLAPSSHFEFSQFLIIDDKTCIIHTGKEKLFRPLNELVKKNLNGRPLDYIVFSHFEYDECGAVKHMWYEPSEQILFSSDFCCQGGICEPVVEKDISDSMIDFYVKGGRS